MGREGGRGGYANGEGERGGQLQEELLGLGEQLMVLRGQLQGEGEGVREKSIGDGAGDGGICRILGGREGSGVGGGPKGGGETSQNSLNQQPQAVRGGGRGGAATGKAGRHGRAGGHEEG